MLARLWQSSVTSLVPLLLRLLLAPSYITAYHLSPTDGQADIGAYHVQPGRCAGVERRLGKARYSYFFGPSPFQTTFSADSSSSSQDAGLGIEQMDSTSLCAFDPELTEGYGAGFDNMRFYLVYSRCIYGTNEMRALCGTTDGKGKPIDKIFNLVQATCPRGTRCKNLCATMHDPTLTSPYAAKQVQLAQCMPEQQWQFLTDMYRPKSALTKPAAQMSAPQAANPHSAQTDGRLDPTVVDKVPASNPHHDQTHTDQDGTIAGKVLPLAAAGRPAGPYTTGHLQLPPNAKPNTPKQAVDSSPPSSPAQSPAEPDAPGDEATRQTQKAPTPMGFRKRSVPFSSGFLRRHRSKTVAAR